MNYYDDEETKNYENEFPALCPNATQVHKGHTGYATALTGKTTQQQSAEAPRQRQSKTNKRKKQQFYWHDDDDSYWRTCTNGGQRY
jgi:hypothetical protein